MTEILAANLEPMQTGKRNKLLFGLDLGYVFYDHTKPNSGLQYGSIYKLGLLPKEGRINSRKQTKVP